MAILQSHASLLLIEGSAGESGLAFKDNRCLDVLRERDFGVILEGRG